MRIMRMANIKLGMCDALANVGWTVGVYVKSSTPAWLERPFVVANRF